MDLDISNDIVDTEIKVLPNLNALDKAITPEIMLFYAQKASESKDKIDLLGAEISQRRDKMRLINDLISEINNLTDEKGNLDISKHPEIQEKMRVLKKLDVNISSDKTKFNHIERDRLMANLDLQCDCWDKENKNQTQKMEIYIKELDRVMMLLKELNKCENQSKRGATIGIKGG